MGKVRQAGNLDPGHEGVQERVQATVTITGSSTSGVASLALDGAFGAVPELVGATFSLENPSAGNASSYVAGHEVDRPNATENGIDVTVHLDAAPGTGESVDVVVTGWADGDAE